MTVVQRMSMLIISAFIGFVVVAGMGYIELGRVYDSANQGNVNSVPSLVVLNKAMLTLSVVRLRADRHVLMTDMEKKNDLESKIREAQALVEKQFKKYEIDGCLGTNCFADDKDKSLLAIDRATVADYNAFVETILTASRQGKFEEARDLLAKSVNLAQKANGALEDHFAYNELLAKKGADEAAAVKSTSVKLSIAIAVFILFVVSLQGVLTLRSVTRPLLKMQKVLTEIELSGDYSKQVDCQSNDEVGQTAHAFNSMMVALQNALSNTNAVMGAVAVGDFKQRITVDARGDLALLKQSVNDSVEKIQITMRALTEVMNALREGDFNKRVDSKVEGEFKISVDQAMQTLQSMFVDVGKVMGAVTHGNLTGRVSANGHGDLATLKEAINEVYSMGKEQYLKKIK